MNVRPFGWLPAQRRAALRVRLDTLLQAWLRQWSMAAPSADLLDLGEARLERCDRLFAQQQARIAFVIEDGNTARLGSLLADVADSIGGQLARDLGESALADLAARWLGVAEGEAASSLPASGLPADHFDARHRSAVFTLRLRGLTLHVGLDAAAIERILPRAAQTASTEELVTRTEALDGSRVRLELQLPLGQAPLSDFLDLACGDVLLCEAPLNTSFRLRSDAGELPFDGRLVRQGDRKAVLLETPRDSA